MPRTLQTTALVLFAACIPPLLSGCGRQEVSATGAPAQAAPDGSGESVGRLHEIIWMGQMTEPGRPPGEVAYIVTAAKKSSDSAQPGNGDRFPIVTHFDRSEPTEVTVSDTWVTFSLHGRRHWIPRERVVSLIVGEPGGPHGEGAPHDGTTEAVIEDEAVTEDDHSH